MEDRAEMLEEGDRLSSGPSWWPGPSPPTFRELLGPAQRRVSVSALAAGYQERRGDPGEAVGQSPLVVVDRGHGDAHHAEASGSIDHHAPVLFPIRYRLNHLRGRREGPPPGRAVHVDRASRG